MSVALPTLPSAHLLSLGVRGPLEPVNAIEETLIARVPSDIPFPNPRVPASG